AYGGVCAGCPGKRRERGAGRVIRACCGRPDAENACTGLPCCGANCGGSEYPPQMPMKGGVTVVVRANGSLLAWRRDAQAGPVALHITKQGLEAIGVKDVAMGAAAETSVSPTLDRTEVEAPAVKGGACRKLASVAARLTRPQHDFSAPGR